MKKVQLFDNRTGEPANPKTLLSYKIKGGKLLFDFIAYDSSLNSYSNINNDELYKGDVVEVFLDVGKEDYYEFEVAPNGACFVAKISRKTPIFIDKSCFKCKSSIKNNDYYVTMIIDLDILNPDNNKIKFNAFRIETKKIRQDYILEALSPTLCDSFHVREKFIDL